MIDWLTLLTDWRIVALIFTNIGTIMTSYILFSSKRANKKILIALAAIPMALFPLVLGSANATTLIMVIGLVFSIIFGMILALMFKEEPRRKR